MTSLKKILHTNWIAEDINTKDLVSLNKSPLYDKYHSSILNGKECLKAYLRRDVKVLIHSCTYMFRKEIITNLYESNPKFFISDEWRAEDVLAISALLYFGNVAYIPEITLHYSIGGITLSSQENYNKTFDFYYSCIKQNHYIASTFNIDQNELKIFYKSYLHFILMQAVHAKDICRLNKWKSLIAELHLPISLKSKIVITLCSTPSKWELLTRLISIKHYLFPNV